jgi:protein ImuB
MFQLLRGEKDRPGTLVARAPDQEIHLVFDEDLQEIDRLLFALTAPLALRCEELRAQGSSAFLVEFEVVIDDVRSVVQWRFPQGVMERVVLDRVRWQLESLVNASRELGNREKEVELWRGGTIQECFVRFSEIGTPPTRQLDLVEQPTGSDDAVVRSLTRLTVSLGEESISTLQPHGGRSPQESVRMIPWTVATGRSGLPQHEERSMMISPHKGVSTRPRRSRQGDGRPPWPGSLKNQDPSVVYQPPRALSVVDGYGNVVGVSARGALTAEIRSVVFEDRSRLDIAEQWGPWLVEERWWSSQRARRYARLLVVGEDRTVHLIYLEQRQWWLEATFD